MRSGLFAVKIGKRLSSEAKHGKLGLLEHIQTVPSKIQEHRGDIRVRRVGGGARIVRSVRLASVGGCLESPNGARPALARSGVARSKGRASRRDVASASDTGPFPGELVSSVNQIACTQGVRRVCGWAHNVGAWRAPALQMVLYKTNTLFSGINGATRNRERRQNSNNEVSHAV